MIIQSGNGRGTTVAMQKVSPKIGAASTPECYNTKLLQHQSATTPNCYSTRVVLHQSGATSMTLFRWHTDAWVAVGRTQKVPEKKWKWWFWRNTNGDSGEIQTPEARGIRVRLGGNGGAEGKNWILLSGKSIWETSRGKKSPIIISSLSSALFFPPRGKMRRSRLNGLIRESEASLSSKRQKNIIYRNWYLSKYLSASTRYKHPQCRISVFSHNTTVFLLYFSVLPDNIESGIMGNNIFLSPYWPGVVNDKFTKK